jgi:hypothetical protein
MKNLVVKIILSLLLLAELSFAATPAGTAVVAQNISITSLGTPQPHAAPLTINVAAIYGFTLSPTSDQIAVCNSLLPVYFAHSIYNQANTTDNLTTSIFNLDTGWQAQLIADDNKDGVHQETETTVLSTPLAIGGQTSLNFLIKFSHTQISTVNTGIIVSTNHTANSYQGFNDILYGEVGWQKATDNIYTGAPLATLALETLLQGYYDPSTNKMITANITVELRAERNTPAAVSYNVQLNNNGHSEMIVCEELAGSYYIYIGHFNHMKVVTDQKISLGGSITTINICDSGSAYYRPLYLSTKAQNVTSVLRTESNNRLTIRGGDYNNDNTINIVDWSAFDYEWKNGGNIADFDGNGIIDTRDYGIWLSNNQDYIPLN